MRRIADVSVLGLAFPIAIAIGYFWGKALDHYLGTTPWCTYIFSAFGVGAGFLNAIRVAMRVGKEEDEADRRGEGS